MPDSTDLQEKRAWLRLSLEPGLGPVRGRALLACFGSPAAIYAASPTALSSVIPRALARQLHLPLPAPHTARIEASLRWLQAPNHHLLTLAHDTYPPTLRDLPDAPLVLYASGQPARLHGACLAIVGARGATPAGLAIARAFGQALAHQGWTIVSGLALGIDAAAHQGALAAGDRGAGTAAVLGTGIDIVYPRGHETLQARIAARGVLLSALPLGTPARRHHFPQRNHLVAALAHGVLVVEAGRHSGALITARLAGELGREVFAVPGSIHSPLSRGCHALIRDGARLVETIDDLRDELQRLWPTPAVSARCTMPPESAPQGPAPDAQQRQVLNALASDTLHADALIALSGLPAQAVAAALGGLALQGRVWQLPDGTYQRR